MASDYWTQKGQFSIVIPFNWQVSEIDSSTEITPQAGDAAIHISVYKKIEQNGPSSPEEAISLVDNFSTKNRLEKIGDYDLGSGEDSQICTGYFSGSEEPFEPSVWLVKGIVGSSKGILVTLCADDSTGQSYKEGVNILSSLGLDEQ